MNPGDKYDPPPTYAETEADIVADRQLADGPPAAAVVCICGPCTMPGYGAPGLAHCAACCFGTMIAEYDHDCPVEEHREMAVRQWGAKEDAR